MIEQLYLDLAEESNDTIIYGKLFQDCTRQQLRSFSERKGGMSFKVISEK